MHVSSRQNAANFCIAYLLSAFGYEFILFVMTVHIYNITNSALNVGIFTSVSFVPRLFSPFYGLIADRYNRKTVFALASGIMSILIIVMSLVNSIKYIYIMWFVISICAMVIMNVRTTLRAEIMTKDNHLSGNSIVLIILNTARILAPFLGGFIAVLWNPKSLLYLTSVIYFMTMIVCRFIDVQQMSEAQHKTARTVLSDIKEGVRYITLDNSLSYLAVIGICWRLFLGLQVSLFVVYVKSFLGLGNTAYGLFMASIGFGSIVGSLLGPGIAKKLETSKLIVWGLSAHYLSFAMLGLIHDFQGALGTVFVSFAFFYITLVGLHSIRDRATRVDVRGRVYGSITAILTPAGIVSMLVGGYLAGIYGTEKVLIAAGLLAAASLMVTRIVFSKHRMIVPEGVQ